MRIFSALAFLCLVQVSLGFFGYTRKFNTHDEPTIPNTNRLFQPNPKAVVQKYIDVPVNHFNSQDHRVFPMRYFENDVHFQPGGPIFLYVGGEWQITAGSINQGTHIYDMAKEYNGTLFYTEHRYYGLSRPTEDTSTENLRYLSVDQALADLAFFINFVKKTYPGLENSGVVMLGASYSATMVAWMRLKYPHLVNGAWASSAPVHAQVDFLEYKEVMSEAINRIGGDQCAATFENAFKQLEEIVDEGNTTKLYTALRLCGPLNLTQDVAHMFYELSDIVAGLVQSHRPGNIEGACDYMRREKEMNNFSDFEAFAAWVNHGNLMCLDLSYQNSVRKFRDVTWGSEANRQMRQWTYQTCSEFAWFQTSTSPKQIFGSPAKYPVDYFVKICEDLYDFKFNLTKIEQNVKRTNIHFGSFLPSLTNVYFTHGDIDPWHPMGVLEDLNESVLVAMLPNNAHVSDMGQISTLDSPEARASKERVMKLAGQWLGLI